MGKKNNLSAPTENDLSNFSHPNNWLTKKKEIVLTIYDIPISQYPNISISPYPYTQSHLRGRVSAIFRDENNDGSPEHASVFSYDILGNVWDLYQYIEELKPYKNEWKQMHYEFDLISGKVKKLEYQPSSPNGGGQEGAWLHKYNYDADNRLREVWTSRDNIYWERDAQYSYYLHGPLKRLLLGERQVQGLDYIYTLNGWVKCLNSSGLDSSRDAGSDGFVGNWYQFVAKDILSYELKYFSGDYKSISTQIVPDNFSNFVSLYNGNIAAALISQDTLMPLIHSYRYDALNRLSENKVFEKGLPTNSWATNYSYDKMGNILSLNRNAKSSKMDSLKYFYYPGKNQLSYVSDKVPANNFQNDIDNQNVNNYKYDAVGNLIYDASEKLKITWTHYGKVKQIDSIGISTVTKLKFKYDASGSRIVKENAQKNEKEIYMRDASGNLLTLYSIRNDSLFAKEFYMYGSSRLGYIDENKFIAKKKGKSYLPPALKFSTPYINVSYTFGKKRYEISDWLGNVRVVINDRKTPQVNANNIVVGYEPQTISVTDYYPFGSEINERSYNIFSYRFGFNGQEKTDEISGSGNHLDFTFRGYDSRRGQFWSVDPLAAKYPWNSPYAFAENRVIDGIDLEGLEWKQRTDQNGNAIQGENGGYSWEGYNDNGTPKEGTVPAAGFPSSNEYGSHLTTYRVGTSESGEKYPIIDIQRANEHGMVELPVTDEGNGQFRSDQAGYNVYNRNDVTMQNGERQLDQWGSPQNIANIFNAALEYNIIMKNVYGKNEFLSIGDISTNTGASPLMNSYDPNNRHASHFNGTQFDWRYPSGQGNYVNNSYNLLRTQNVISIANRHGFNVAYLSSGLKGKIQTPFGTIIYNPTGNTLIEGWKFGFKGHEDHGHLGK